MPPPLPARYALEVRLGRDGDLEEWLATDTSLDRPVLIRFLGPEVGEERRERFLEVVRGAAAVNHPHLAAVFTADRAPDGAYAVSEWTGAISLADRLAAGETIDVREFLPNAAGLASALAALHAEGVIHGAIDTRCVFYAVAHPATLGGVGRADRDHTAIDDVRSLARVLEEGLTGSPPGGPPPSELVDGLHPRVDEALRRAQQGKLTAQGLADALTAAPSPVLPTVESPRSSRRLLLVAVSLVAAALVLIGAGRLLVAGVGSPILVPIAPRPDPTLPPATTIVTTPTTDTGERPPLEVTSVDTFDPFGGGGENDDRLPSLIDRDPDTVWRTERYRDPLSRLKPGVGIVFEVAGMPGALELAGITDGVEYEIAWSESPPDDPDGWERLVGGVTVGSDLALSLPEREGGRWVLWLTELPQREDGDYWAEVAEVRFRP